MVVAVDGPAAAGKGTLARRLATTLNLVYLDTGSIYRAVAAKLLAAGGDPNDAETATEVARTLVSDDLGRDDLRAEGVGAAASIVSAHQDVRAALLDFQRAVAFDPPPGRAGAVLDGRDIGTVVCPEACAKLFVTASLEERARRRHEELLGRGEERIYARVLEDLKERDARDSARATAPMTAAADAVTLDTSDLDVETAFRKALDIVRTRCGVTAA
ncbi:(d)CMP kinase [Rhodovibrio salinarum]|uniref:(d)CMP kinase n=1 Tax=Rhodovibrio salinarum TaxID=1087 RepID=UPI0004863808|nr:(d)CMP kinase [Rhodovibrio salinarum]